MGLFFSLKKQSRDGEARAGVGARGTRLLHAPCFGSTQSWSLQATRWQAKGKSHVPADPIFKKSEYVITYPEPHLDNTLVRSGSKGAPGSSGV